MNGAEFEKFIVTNMPKRAKECQGNTRHKQILIDPEKLKMRALKDITDSKLVRNYISFCIPCGIQPWTELW